MPKYEKAGFYCIYSAFGSTLCNKKVIFSLFFVQKSAILDFLKKSKNTRRRIMIWHISCEFEDSMSNVFVCMLPDARTEGRKDGLNVILYPPLGCMTPEGDNN